MIKVEVIKVFNLARYDELKNIERKSIDTKGKLYVGDTFECSKELADYLLGNNPLKEAVVKVIEIEPIKVEVKNEVIIDSEKIKEEVVKTKKSKKNKK